MSFRFGASHTAQGWCVSTSPSRIAVAVFASTGPLFLVGVT
jgi:hypothetical protein